MKSTSAAHRTLGPALVILFCSFLFFVPSAAGQADVTGQWQTVPYTMPVNPIHVSLLHSGKILAVGGSENYPPYLLAGQFRAALVDLQAGTATIQNVPWDMFCNQMVNLPDGRILVDGGNLQYDPFLGSPRASAFDPATNQYVDVQTMAHGRWYPTALVLGDGSVMTFSGLNDSNGATNTTVEIYKIGSGWSQEYGAGWIPPLYPRLHLLPSGKVFYSSPGPDSAFFDPATKNWTLSVAHTNYGSTRTYGSSVLLPLTPQNGYKPRVMILGGGGSPSTATTEIIDLSVANPSWRSSTPMSAPRMEMNAVLLPTGKVLALGGSAYDEDASTASLGADLFDPVTETMTSAGAGAFPRLYHSIGLLLPDATVWVAGGNPTRGSYEPHMEIYSPAYLFTKNAQGVTVPATRPTITSGPSTIGYGATFTVQTPDAANISSISLMRLGSPTHSFDTDQRLLGLSFTAGAGSLTVTGPANGNLAPPGYYMLFILNSAGVPSVASIVQLSPTPNNQLPKGTITQPSGGVIIGVGQSVTFAGTATDPDGTIASYNWVLPGGSPNQSTAQNPGAATFSTPGTYTASLTVLDNSGANDPSPPIRTIVVQPVPSLTSINPSSGALGQTLNVTLTGNNFAVGNTCSLGAGITVNSCAFNSSTTLVASITVAASATLGTRSVTVANAGGQSSTLANSFTVRQTSSFPPPTLTSISPDKGNQGQTLTVTLGGSNFQSGATCAFGNGITVNSCSFVSGTQLSASITIAANATPGTTAVTVANPDQQSVSMLSGFSVSGGGGLIHIDFIYPDRNSLLTDGWSYKGTTSGGQARNTEQTGTLAVDYDQSAHPGTIRIPLGAGELWQSLNSSENTLFRSLPPNWNSIRLKIASFSPNSEYQQVDLLAYQDDDNYVDLDRIYSSGQAIEFFRESGQATAYASHAPIASVNNLILRIDRSSNVYSGFYSIDNGANWASVGSITLALTNPKLAIETGSNPNGPIPADLLWVEIVMSSVLPPPTLSSSNPNSAVLGQSLNIVLTGANFQNGAICNFGPGVTVNACTFNSATQLTANINVASNAATGLRAITITNPDNQSATLNTGLTITPPVPPSVSSLSPTSANQGVTTNVTITGTGFQSGATCNFGAGIIVNSCAFNSTSQLTANNSVAFNATVGTRTVTVTNPDSQSSSLSNSFTVNQAPPPPPPAVTSVTPNSGAQNTTLSVTVAGSNFLSGATCNFGSGINVNSCTFNSATQLTANLSILSGAAIGSRSVIVVNPDSQSSTLSNGFSVTAGVPGPAHFDFNYADRNALTAAGWSYIATTATGAGRNSEQTGSLAVSYDQTVHPGTIRIPLAQGEMWQALNSSANTLFHALPSNWTSIRLKIASFAPQGAYQQIGLLVYQNDDNYVDVNRGFGGGPDIEYFRESAQATSYISSGQSLTNTSNVILRADRSGNTYSGFYSLDGGSTWTSLGSTTITLNNPTLAIEIGANQQGTIPTADLGWVEILQSSALPAPTLTSVTPTSGSQGSTLNVILSGTNFQTGAGCGFGSSITVNSCTLNSSTQITANITVSSSASQAPRTITVTNPDNQSAILNNTFSVVPPVPPSVTAISPTSAAQTQNVNVAITGSNFQTGATCAFGTGVTVNSCVFLSSTKLMANLDIAGNATVGSSTVTVTNLNGQSGSLTAGFAITAAPTSANINATALILINSTNSVGYNTNVSSPGEFQRYIQPYLDHLQVPYQIADVSSSDPASDLASRALIIAGHSILNLSAAWQNAIAGAVNAGSGFVNLDSDLSIGSAIHMQKIFGATGAVIGTAATSVSVPAAVMSTGSTPHFIAAMQKKFLGDAAGDNVYFFHPDGQSNFQSVTATLLQGASGTVIAKLGSDPLVLAQSHGAGRAVNFGSYGYLKADRFGFVQGMDDIFWRSLVWAARKPFVLRGYPRLWAVQMDDTNVGWGSVVQDLYNPAFTGNVAADGTGGPWKVTGYLFVNNLPAGSSERASVIADINAGKLQVVAHSLTNAQYGDMYWNGTTGQLTDSQWLSNLSAINAFKTGNGGADAIPFFSRALVAHWWDLSNNAGYDLWNTLGIRYITTIQRPGFAQPFANINQYAGAERIPAGPFWKYEQPPKTVTGENFPFFFADDYVVGSRAGLPSQTFYLFTTQYQDPAKYGRPDFVWPSTSNNMTPTQSVDQLQRYTWRQWSGLNPVQLFTHHASNYELATAADRQTVISQGSTWLQSNGVRHTFMQDLGDYMYARNKSTLTQAQVNGSNLQLTFTGNAATADGVLISTSVLVFNQDVEGFSVTIPGFTNGFSTGVSLTAFPTVTAANPNSLTQGQTGNVTLAGTNFQSGATCSFGSGITVSSCTFNSATQLTANITVPSTATVGTRSVVVTNPDGRNGVFQNGFSVTQFVGPPPTLTSATPNSGGQGQTLNVVLAGTNFLNGATCILGSGITVNSCTFNSSTQLTANITIAAGATTGSRTITVTNPDGHAVSLTNGFTVTGPPPPTHIDFNYSDRTSFLAAGWSYTATTASAGSRNTEQTGALAVSYDQTAHPGTVRIPLGSGELWQALNSSQNTIFRSLPSNWSSVRVKIASFSPTTTYQQVGLLAYQDDDNYVYVDRIRNSAGQQVELFRESAQVTAYASQTTVTATSNLILRLDRNGNVYTAFYSTDGGTTWVSAGNITLALTNPKLAIQTGSSPSGTVNADFAWVEYY